MTEVFELKIAPAICFPLQSYLGKALMGEGQQIGRIKDFLLDPTLRRVVGLVTHKGSIVSAADISLWDKNRIEVDHLDMDRPQVEQPELEQALSLLGDLRGRAVVTLDGDKIGELKDFRVDSRGELAEFEIARSGIELTSLFPADRDAARVLCLPRSALHTLNVDFITVELHRVSSLDLERFFRADPLR